MNNPFSQGIREFTTRYFLMPGKPEKIDRSGTINTKNENLGSIT